jgi:hypothetical protein
VHLTNHCKIFVNIEGLLDYHHLSVLLCFRSLRFLIQRRSLGRCAKDGYRSSAPIRAVLCKTFANVAGAVSLDGLPSTNAQQRARTSIHKHYPPDVGTSKKFGCSCALDLNGLFMFVGEFVKSERKQLFRYLQFS